MSDLEMRDGSGVAARFYPEAGPAADHGAPAAPCCRWSTAPPRCRPNAAAREMLRDSLTGLPNRLAFTEVIEGPAGREPGDGRAMRCWWSTCPLQPDQREHGRPCRRRIAHHLRPPPDLGVPGGRSSWHAPAATNSGSGRVAPGNDDPRGRDRILDPMHAPFRLTEFEIRVECAIGVALTQSVQDAEELFRNAQFACKQAKASGRPKSTNPTKPAPPAAASRSRPSCAARSNATS